MKDYGEFSYQNQSEWQFLTGMMQSPINIDTQDVVAVLDDENAKICLAYSSKVDSVEMYKSRMQINSSGRAIINGRRFDLQQYHFHAPSEHTVNEKHYPMEAHFVHEAQSGRKAVIAVFFEVGNFNIGFEDVLRDMKKMNTKPISAMLMMLPRNKSYYHYLGSLTTPPVMENAEWYVMKEVMEISQKQLEIFEKFYKGNHRDIHPRNDRVVLEYNE